MKPTPEEILRKAGYDEDAIFISYETVVKYMQEYAEQYHKEKQVNISIDALDFVHYWFYKLAVGEVTYGEVADAIEQFHKEKLREDAFKLLIAYHCELPGNIAWIPENANRVINEYFKLKR